MAETILTMKEELCEAIGRAVTLARLANSPLTVHILLIALLNECDGFADDDVDQSENKKYFLV